jgi:hypothetical protein
VEEASSLSSLPSELDSAEDQLKPVIAGISTEGAPDSGRVGVPLQLVDLFCLPDRLSVHRVLEPLDHRFKVCEALFDAL